ncbi:MAG: DUF4442 domain-containing protein [Bacteroidales bacterium]|nr:DUF4442 domain-containing protein [Bacteroidales bacterium]
MDKSEQFRQTVRNNFKFKLFMLKSLPSAFFSGLKVTEITEKKAVVSVPFKFFTQNPFKSIYFASQAMAAELSTGVLALSHVHKRNPRVSMLVFNMRADFTKKAKSRVFFTCEDGLNIKNAVEKSIKTGEGIAVEAKSTGKTSEGEIVSEFYFTWTFKPVS